MLKYKKDSQNNIDQTKSTVVLDETLGLSSDLIDEEQTCLEDHKDPPLRTIKPTRVYKRRVPEVATTRRCSARLKNRKKN
jgi:hypothetical protein